MGGKNKYIEMFGSFTEPFNCKDSVAKFLHLHRAPDHHQNLISIPPLQKMFYHNLLTSF